MRIPAKLVEGVYEELRRLARGHLRRLGPGTTLQPTVLLHEAYLRLDGAAATVWSSRTHFISTASRTMRNVLVDYVRERTARKRGGDWKRIPLSVAGDGPFHAATIDLDQVLALDEALARLERMDARKARVVELRFFGGLEQEEIGELLEISLPTVKRDWQFARAWLFDEMRGIAHRKSLGQP